MNSVDLTANQLAQWLAGRGIQLKGSFWQVLNQGCYESSVFEYPFTIDQVPWQGVAHLQTSFVESRKLRMSRLRSSPASIQLVPDNTIFVLGITLEAVICYPRRLQRPATWFTPHIAKPSYGIRIDYPNIDDLEIAWQTIASVAPTVYSATEDLVYELEAKVMGLHGAELPVAL